MKKIVSALLMFLLLTVLTGCGSSATDKNIILENKNKPQATANSGAANKKKIALVMKTLTNPFFIEMEKGARRAEKELGIELIVKTGAKETSVDQQIGIIEELIRDKVDGIVIAPASSVELIPVLKKAQDANITIINIDNQLDPEVARQVGLQQVPFISVDNEKGAYLSAKYISDRIKEPAQAAILEGIRAAKNAQDRKNGAIKAFAENSNIKLVATETANWKIDEAYTVAADLFAKHPDIKALFCANDMMALGAIKYLKEKDRHDVQVAAFDDLKEARQEFAAGNLADTIDQQADLQGYLGVKYAVEKANGKAVPDFSMVDVRLVTARNLH